jgi:NTP pyrophosphatase (non-canonical NTP hydrolase)
MELSAFLKMQHDLAVEKGWIWDRTPEQGPFSLLWSMDELGEAISIIKKKGSYGIMENPAVREHFVEEIADHLMYVFDMMECYSITAEEFETAYVKKFERNMGRSWSENEHMYENVGIRSAVIDGRFLPDERLWELLVRAGVKVTVVAEDPDAMRPVIDSLVNDSAKVAVSDKAPADDGAFVVSDAETLEKLRALFGEQE